MNKEEIQRNLSSSLLVNKAIYIKKVDSTNEEAKRMINANAGHGTLIIAEDQDNGKGRMGKCWSSSMGEGLYFSLLLKGDINIGSVSFITLMAGLAVCKAINSICLCNAKIKWPNDVIINNKKVCGILCESLCIGNSTNIVIGIGVNVNNREFNDDIKHKATSIFLEVGKETSRVKLLNTIIFELERLYIKFTFGNKEELINEYDSLCASIGRRVCVYRNNIMVKGDAIRTSEDGELVVQLESKEIIFVNSGEVTIQGIY